MYEVKLTDFFFSFNNVWLLRVRLSYKLEHKNAEILFCSNRETIIAAGKNGFAAAFMHIVTLQGFTDIQT